MKAARRYYRWFGIRSSLLNNYKKGRFIIFLIRVSFCHPTAPCAVVVPWRNIGNDLPW